MTRVRTKAPTREKQRMTKIICTFFRFTSELEQKVQMKVKKKKEKMTKIISTFTSELKEQFRKSSEYA